MPDMTRVPERTWPELATPPAGELFDWLRAFTDEHDRGAAEWYLKALLEAAHRGDLCFAAAHHAYPDQVEQLRGLYLRTLEERDLAEIVARAVEHDVATRLVRLERAWRSASRRARRERARAARAYADGWREYGRMLEELADRAASIRRAADEASPAWYCGNVGCDEIGPHVHQSGAAANPDAG